MDSTWIHGDPARIHMESVGGSLSCRSRCSLQETHQCRAVHLLIFCDFRREIETMVTVRKIFTTKNLWIFLIVFLVMELSVVVVNAVPHGKRVVRSAQRFCGKSLSNALSMFCSDRGGFHGGGYYNSVAADSKIGIVARCCHKPCEIEELQSYCAH